MKTIVVSHEVRAERQQAVIRLKNEHGAEHTLQITIGPAKQPCPHCGRGWPLLPDGSVDVAAAIAAEQELLDAAAAAVNAYAAKHGCQIITPATPAEESK